MQTHPRPVHAGYPGNLPPRPLPARGLVLIPAGPANPAVLALLRALIQGLQIDVEGGGAAPTAQAGAPSFLQAAAEQATQAHQAHQDSVALRPELAFAHRLISMLLTDMTLAQALNFARLIYRQGLSDASFSDSLGRHNQRAEALAKLGADHA